jgi:hypothetical protein
MSQGLGREAERRRDGGRRSQVAGRRSSWAARKCRKGADVEP